MKARKYKCKFRKQIPICFKVTESIKLYANGSLKYLDTLNTIYTIGNEEVSF